MTLRCNRRDSNVSGIAALLILCAACSTSVSAQDEGASIPAPPQIKRTSDNTADPEFKTPAMTRNGAGANQMLRKARRQNWKLNKSINNGMVPGPNGDEGSGFANDFGPGAGPGFGGPAGGPGFGGPGGGPGAGGPGFGGGGDFPSGRGSRFPGGPGFGPASNNEGFGGGRFAGRAGMQRFGDRRGGPGQMSGFAGHRLDLTPLNLTEEQKQKIKQLRQANKDRIKDIRQNLMSKQIQLRNLLFSPDATDSQIRTARRDVRKIQDQIEEIGLDDMLGIRSVLTPDQKAKLPDIAPPLPNTPPTSRRTAER